jgi:hypothetical protein
MNRFPVHVIPIYFQFIQMAIAKTKFGILCILTFSRDENVIVGDWDLDGSVHLVSDYIRNTVRP